MPNCVTNTLVEVYATSHKRHGGPYDRGSADSYYRRGRDPHYYVGGTGTSKKVEYDDMTAAEISAYHLGYANNEAEGNHND